jgi:hypothetical protein
VRVLRREPLAVLGFSAPQPLRLALFGVGLGVLALFVNGIVGMIFVSAGIRQNQAALYPLFPGDYLGQALSSPTASAHWYSPWRTRWQPAKG